MGMTCNVTTKSNLALRTCEDRRNDAVGPHQPQVSAKAYPPGSGHEKHKARKQCVVIDIAWTITGVTARCDLIQVGVPIAQVHLFFRSRGCYISKATPAK
ncbi:hypothetical protein BAUCODRAFT_400371 [Baudoinia panamericana UAMH 10762]|uniref:Uncharacterized protein n=1 Tax=Baudoinia panamericana (strain UAMH 10762) TaxID=717646 RepID=M2N5R0_BAUPA|nr:uncharacterized protein BAUCODRAFT_400371 [Baudoinia panamericana UAMH 10762]EMC99368.1 hypothetical protein BAUCODRAFT_400371 [Baudoinia panamericana UAMH 10762]